MFVLQMKIGTVPYGPMQVKYARSRPPIGKRVFVREVGRASHIKWEQVLIEGYNSDGYCFASRI